MKKQGVLLINLGSPDSTSVGDVRTYLREFLMDGRVLDAPWPIRWAVVHLAILPFRPKQSAHAYESIWSPEGSPLVVTSKKVAEAVSQRLGDGIPVELAMRYRNPSIKGAIEKLKARGVTDLLVFPLFPHYAMSSFETAAVRARELANRLAPEMSVTVIPPYYEHPEYVAALVESARPHLVEGFDHLLFSFHGIPERHLRKGDPDPLPLPQSPRLLQRPEPSSCDLLQGAVSGHRAGLREGGWHPRGEVLRLVPVAPRQGSLAPALHRQGVGALRRREEG